MMSILNLACDGVIFKSHSRQICGPEKDALASANKKKSLPLMARVTTLHVVPGWRDVGEPLSAKIVLPIERNALHFETVCALWLAGRVLMRWQCVPR